MPWGAIICAAIEVYGEPASSDSFSAYTRASRISRKRTLAALKPWLIAAGVVAGLWLGYQAMLWVLWWGPHPLQLTPFSYGQ